MSTKKIAPVLFVTWGSLTLLFVLERMTKYVARAVIPEHGWLLTENGFGFFIEHNQGVAFSVPLSFLLLSLVVGMLLLVLVVLHVRAYKKNEVKMLWGTGCIIIGAVSNFLDRIHYGSVIDFIRLFPWPTFNIADCFILLGVSILIVSYYRNQRIK